MGKESYGKMKRQQITLRIPTELNEWLQEQASRLGVSFNGYVVMILQQKMINKQI